MLGATQDPGCNLPRSCLVLNNRAKYHHGDTNHAREYQGDGTELDGRFVSP